MSALPKKKLVVIRKEKKEERKEKKEKKEEKIDSPSKKQIKNIALVGGRRVILKRRKRELKYKIYTSIDIGGRNYNILIQKRYDRVKNERHKPPKNLLWTKFSLFEGQKKIKVTQTALKILTNELDSLSKLIKRSFRVLVERQPGGKSNAMMRIEQHTLTYFDLRYPELKTELVPSKWKFTHLGAPGKMTGYKRKKWSVQKAKELLKERKCYKELAYLEEQDKQDDYAETYTQIEGYIINKGLD